MKFSLSDLLYSSFHENMRQSLVLFRLLVLYPKDCYQYHSIFLLMTGQSALSNFAGDTELQILLNSILPSKNIAALSHTLSAHIPVFPKLSL